MNDQVRIYVIATQCENPGPGWVSGLCGVNPDRWCTNQSVCVRPARDCRHARGV